MVKMLSKKFFKRIFSQAYGTLGPIPLHTQTLILKVLTGENVICKIRYLVFQLHPEIMSGP